MKIRPKHVEKRNEYVKKNCAPIWRYLQGYLACSLLLPYVYNFIEFRKQCKVEILVLWLLYN